MKKFRLFDLQYNHEADFKTSSLHCFGERFINEHGQVEEFVGSLAQDGDFYSKDTTNFLDKNLNLQKRFLVQYWTGLFDIHGKQIFEGDEVVEYPDNRGVEKVDDDIFVLSSQRGPLKDVVVYKGRVVWDAPRFAIEVKGRMDGVVLVDMVNGANYEILQCQIKTSESNPLKNTLEWPYDDPTVPYDC